jgi:hypothetical protein
MSMIIAIRTALQKTSLGGGWLNPVTPSVLLFDSWFHMVPLYCHYCITVESLQITVFMLSWYLIIFARKDNDYYHPYITRINGGYSHYISNFDSCS